MKVKRCKIGRMNNKLPLGGPGYIGQRRCRGIVTFRYVRKLETKPTVVTRNYEREMNRGTGKSARGKIFWGGFLELRKRTCNWMDHMDAMELDVRTYFVCFVVSLA